MYSAVNGVVKNKIVGRASLLIFGCSAQTIRGQTKTIPGRDKTRKPNLKCIYSE